MYKQRGFTLVEMLIVLFIMIFLALATVPMLGSVKAKKPVTSTRHGIVECYYAYDDSGALKLYRYEANNSDNKAGILTEMTSGYCEFQPPSGVNYFTLKTLGAGGDGADVVPSYTLTSFSENGTISTKEEFAEQIKNAPAWLRSYWDLQWEKGATPPEYTLDTGIGDGGMSDCVRNVNMSTGELVSYTCGAGGDSGAGLSATFNYSLLASSNVVFDGNSLSFSDSDRVLTTPSTNGEDGVANDDFTATEGSDGVAATVECSSNIQCVVEDKGKRNGVTVCPDASNYEQVREARLGVQAEYSVNPASIAYSAQRVAVNATFGTHGEVGKFNHLVYERLPKVHLIPAKTKEDASKISVVAGSTETVLLKSDLSVDGTPKSLQNITSNGNNFFPFPDTYLPQIEPSSPAGFIEDGFGSQIAKLFEQGYVVGQGGQGTFPIITSVDSEEFYQINGVAFDEVEVKYNEDLTDWTCPDGSEPESGTVYYCKSTTGNPGAVIVTW